MALTILLVLASLYPISLSVGSGDWASDTLLIALDVLMVAVRIVVARKQSALPAGSSNDPPQEVSGR